MLESSLQLWNNDIYKYDYTFCYNHNVAVTNFFYQVEKNDIIHEPQTDMEYYYSKMCNNQAPLYCEKGEYPCFGYDFSFNHGSVMAESDLRIPTKEGREVFLDEIPKLDNIKVGYYHIRITSDYEYIHKVFYFSSYDWYTNVDLEFVLENKKLYKFKLELVVNDAPNAYLYRTKDLVYTKDLFGNNWYRILCEYRKAFPTNILVKFMCSSLHGQLSSLNTKWKTKEEVEDEKLKICWIVNAADYTIVDEKRYMKNDKVIYKLMDNEKPYKHDIRLQSFLLAKVRAKTASVVAVDIKRVARIHTDNISFRDVDPKLNIKGLKAEAKTTNVNGMKWNHVNEGLHKCKCGEYVKFEDLKSHCT